MTSSDDLRPEQAAQPAEAPQEIQRNLPHLLGELAQHAGDGAAAWAGGYAAKTVKEKVFGGRGQDKDGAKPDPPAEPPPAHAE